ncbi:hypothetical protein Tco_1198768, partial [Tanacetum coccineum]
MTLESTSLLTQQLLTHSSKHLYCPHQRTLRNILRISQGILVHRGVLKPHHISATSFQTPSASKVSLTSHMLKVAKLSKKPEESLILPSKEVNAEESADKSQSGTNLQPLSQPKAPTAKKPRKKKNPSSTQPK